MMGVVDTSDWCEIDMDDGFAGPVTLAQFLTSAVIHYRDNSIAYDSEMFAEAVGMLAQAIEAERH